MINWIKGREKERLLDWRSGEASISKTRGSLVMTMERILNGKGWHGLISGYTLNSSFQPFAVGRGDVSAISQTQRPKRALKGVWAGHALGTKCPTGSRGIHSER